MRSWWKIVLPLLVLAVGVGGLVLLRALKPEASRSPVELVPPVATTVTVDPGPRRIDAASQGMLRPRAVIPLAAEVGGVVTWTSPRLVAGAAVETGAELLRIDQADYRAALATAEAELAELRRLLAEELAASEVAVEEWAALGQGEPSDLALRRPQLAAVRARIAAAEARLERARRDLERTVLRAPEAGRIATTAVERGQLVARGQELLRLQAGPPLEVVLPVTLEQLRFLDLPLDGALLADGPAVVLRGRVADRPVEWRGYVHRTLPGVSEQTRMLRAVVRVPGDDAGPPLIDGLYVEAEIAGAVVENVVALPASAVQPGDVVFVAIADDAGHRLEERALEILRRGEDEVLARGPLAAGERVVGVRLPQMRAGMRVRLQDEGGRLDDAAEPAP